MVKIEKENKRKKIEKGRKIKGASESEKDESLLREQSRRKEITNKD